jgi:hypothetical protein
LKGGEILVHKNEIDDRRGKPDAGTGVHPCRPDSCHLRSVNAGGNACRRGRRESPPEILGKVILVMSGQSRKMYQYLEPKPEGTILPKRSTPQEVGQLSSRHWCQYRKLAGDQHTRRCCRQHPLPSELHGRRFDACSSSIEQRPCEIRPGAAPLAHDTPYGTRLPHWPWGQPGRYCDRAGYRDRRGPHQRGS